MLIPDLLVLASLLFAAVEDAISRKVHLYAWIPFAVGAIWIFSLEPLVLIPFLSIMAISEIAVRAKLLGGADPMAFAGITLLGFSFSFLYASLAFSYLLIAWAAYLILRKKLIFKEHLPAIPICAASFLLALLLSSWM